ncbi:MAG: hypothetical protein IJD82_07450 [Clostridia bacterium]|nr:hypothetical protein [Clostridia bacterium]
MLQKRTLLCKENLRDSAYLEDLLAEGERVGALTETDSARIQYDVLELLQKRLESLYGKRTSSVPDEIAEELMESVLYTVSLTLRASPDPDAALRMLCDTPMELLYQKGLRYCRILLRDVRVLTKKLQAEETPAFNPFYRAAIGRDLPAFLRTYKPDSRAHEHSFFPTYAVTETKNTLSGVLFVRDYAKRLLAETRFCNLFDRTELSYVLSSPRARGENVFEAVLRQASVSVLALGTVSLRTTQEDARFVRETFDAREAEKQLRNAFARFPFAFSTLERLSRELTAKGR